MHAITSPVKERPIIFSAAMVRAILEGRKTQTRRIIKSQKPYFTHFWPENDTKGREFFFIGNEGAKDERGIPIVASIRCPYGQPGDRLWVRETWADTQSEPPEAVYRADGERPWSYLPWRPSIHMPRWASRITLEIVSVRVERLQDIDEADAYAEGVECWSEGDLVHYNIDQERSFKTPQDAFRKLWSNLFGTSNWEANPWVWVIGFKRVDA